MPDSSTTHGTFEMSNRMEDRAIGGGSDAMINPQGRSSAPILGDGSMVRHNASHSADYGTASMDRRESGPYDASLRASEMEDQFNGQQQQQGGGIRMAASTPVFSTNVPPICQNCNTSTTPLWRRSDAGATLCNACGLFLKLHGRSRPISLKTDVIKSRNRVKNAGQQRNSKQKEIYSPNDTHPIAPRSSANTPRRSSSPRSDSSFRSVSPEPLVSRQSNSNKGVKRPAFESNTSSPMVKPSDEASPRLGALNTSKLKNNSRHHSASPALYLHSYHAHNSNLQPPSLNLPPSSLAGSNRRPLYDNIHNGGGHFQLQQQRHSPDPAAGDPNRSPSPSTSLLPPMTIDSLIAENANLRTRVSELDLVNDLFRGRVSELEANESKHRLVEHGLRERIEALERDLERFLASGRADNSSTSSLLPTAAANAAASSLHTMAAAAASAMPNRYDEDEQAKRKRLRLPELMEISTAPYLSNHSSPSMTPSNHYPPASTTMDQETGANNLRVASSSASSGSSGHVPPPLPVNAPSPMTLPPLRENRALGISGIASTLFRDQPARLPGGDGPNRPKSQ